MEFTCKNLTELNSETVVFLVTDNNLPKTLTDFDKNSQIGGQIAAAISADKAFNYKPSQIISILAPVGIRQKQLLILSLGQASEITPLSLQANGGSLVSKLNQMKVTEIDLIIEDLNLEKETSIDLALNLFIGMKLKNYAFLKYYVAKKSEHEIIFKKLNLIVQSQEATTQAINQAVGRQSKILDGVALTKDLVTETPNSLNPTTFAAICKDLAKLGVKVTILDKPAIQNLKMGALLGVAQGSVNEPKVVIMEWQGNPDNQEITALVGKGVTFDSGGINLKPSNSIADMKYDMAGAAAVTGTIKALADRKAKANVVGIIGLVENMPSGSAQRPSDVVVSMSGQTIEVDNTDAEGRLVLADIMWYIQENYKPKQMIDLATLTGAIVVALGDSYAGLFSNNDKLAQQLIAAATAVGEPVWRMPLNDSYDKQINSDIADIKNVGQSGRGAGSATAAHFLKRFIKDCAWAHLDIAGMAWTKYGNDVCSKGATGFGVRLLDQYISSYIENK